MHPYKLLIICWWPLCSSWNLKGDILSLDGIKNTLAWLCRIYGQVVNFCKSNVFFSSNMHDNEQRNLASILWVNLASCPWNISRNETRFVICPWRKQSFQYILDRISNKRQGWKSKFLTQVDRLTLIKPLLQEQALPIFLLVLKYLNLKIICKKMDFIICSFWWGDK